MAIGLIPVVNELYNTQSKQKALFRDLKVYLNSKGSYKDQKQNILSYYLEELKKELLRLNKQYKGKNKDGMMEDFVQLSLYIEAIEFFMNFEDTLYKHLDSKTNRDSGGAEERHDPYI